MSDLTDVRAWCHIYAPEPLKTKLEGVLARLDDLVDAANVLCEGVETGGGTFSFEKAYKLREAVNAVQR